MGDIVRQKETLQIWDHEENLQQSYNKVHCGGKDHIGYEKIKRVGERTLLKGQRKVKNRRKTIAVTTVNVNNNGQKN